MRGAPATLDARGAGTTLTVSSGTVNVVGLTITGGTGTDICAPNGCFAGGGVFNDFGGTLILFRSRVSGNVASFAGSLSSAGGVFNLGALTVVASAVSGNSARYASRISNATGSATVALRYASVTGNSASTGDGGGIGNFNGATVTIDHSLVSGNSAGSSGGGVWSAGNLTIGNSAINGKLGPIGGGIFNDVLLTLTRSVVSGNSASNGAGVMNIGGNVTVSQSTVRKNMATFDGGGFFNGSGPLRSRPTHPERQLRIRSQWRWRWHLQRLDSREHRIDHELHVEQELGNLRRRHHERRKPDRCKLHPERELGLERWRHLQRQCWSHHRFLDPVRDGQRGEPRRRLLPISGMATSNGFNLVGADCAFSSIGDQTVADTAHAESASVRSPTTEDPRSRWRCSHGAGRRMRSPSER